jgi:hypothetical protein
MGDGPVVMETWEVAFAEEESVVFTLKENYDSAPIVLLTSYGSGDDSDLNVYISKIEIGGVAYPGSKKCSVTIATSTRWTGTVLLQAIKAGQ